MTRLLNRVDLTLVLIPFKKTYCSVYIHVDKLVQKNKAWGKRSASSLWASTEYIVQYVFAGVSVWVWFDFYFLVLDIKTDLMVGAKERGPSEAEITMLSTCTSRTFPALNSSLKSAWL